MKRKKKSVKISRELRTHRNLILNAILSTQKLYIKNTGIEVKLTDYDQWARRYTKTSLQISVVIVGTPTIQALDKMKSFRLDQRNDNNGGTQVTAHGDIQITDLSVNPFDTKASRILHGRT